MSFDTELTFAANVSTMFRALDFDLRFQAAKEAGFNAVEVQYPYTKTPKELAQLCKDARVQLVLMNAPAGDAALGERGWACLPHRVEAFRNSIETALDYAQATGCAKLHVLSGVPDDAVDKQTAYATLINNLQWAVALCSTANVTVLIEALNAKDVPGYLFHTNAEAAQIVEAVGHDFCKLQFDTYHCWAQGGDVLAEFDRYENLIGHVQIADWPGRGAPASGAGDWNAFWAKLKASCYNGHVGCEYLS